MTKGSYTSSTGTIVIGNSSNEYRLRKYIEDLENAILQRDATIQQLVNHVNEGVFSDDELKFLLMRCHPDKNPDSEMANQITAKLIEFKKQK
jgi:hypothetical protein